MNITPVVLCGGSGTRLWPLPRAGFPKQFLCLTGKESLFQQAAERLVALGNEEIQVSVPYIVSNESHRFLALEQLHEVGIDLGAALLEPTGRNTAPALTLPALAALEKGDDPILAVTPADQTVGDHVAFTSAMQTAIRGAETGAIVILGVTPDRPETGHGRRLRPCYEPGPRNLDRTPPAHAQPHQRRLWRRHHLALLAELVKEVTGFEGEIVKDTSKPDGIPRKQLDTCLINRLGWKPKMPLREGLEKTYEEFKHTLAD